MSSVALCAMLVAMTGAIPPAKTSTAVEATVDVDKLEFKLSLPTASDYEAWEDPGLRLTLGYVHTRLHGMKVARDSAGNGLELRMGVQLSELWSLHAQLRYSFATINGVVFTGTIQPTFHVVGGLSVSLGLGMTVFVLPEDELAPEPEVDIVASRSYPSDQRIISACTGAGLIAQARAQYLFVIASAWASGPVLQVGLSRTGCQQSLSAVDIDTGESIVLKQFWTHFSWSLGWLLAWR